MTENERDREYRLAQKRGYGESVVGERGESLEKKGDVAEVEREREEWESQREARSRQDF